MKLLIDENGASGFNCDMMDQVELGHRKVPRVSDIAWNEKEQAWEVRGIIRESKVLFADGELAMNRILSRVLYSSKIRKDCIRWELMNEDQIRERTNQ